MRGRPPVREITGLSDSSIDRQEAKGEFPRRVRIGANSIAWFEDEVIAWLESRERGGVKRPERAIAGGAKRRAELAAAEMRGEGA